MLSYVVESITNHFFLWTSPIDACASLILFRIPSSILEEKCSILEEKWWKHFLLCFSLPSSIPSQKPNLLFYSLKLISPSISPISRFSVSSQTSFLFWFGFQFTKVCVLVSLFWFWKSLTSCSYTAVLTTSCSSTKYTRDQISISFGDAYGNQVRFSLNLILIQNFAEIFVWDR